MMLKRKPKKQTPKLENVGKMIAVSIVVPLISSLVIYWINANLPASTAGVKGQDPSHREVPKLASTKSD